MTTPAAIILTLFSITNLVAYVLMWFDKRRSRKKGMDRIPEGVLFFIAILFGSIGVYLGMYTFRHKTLKWYFTLGIPLILLQQAICLYALYDWLI